MNSRYWSSRSTILFCVVNTGGHMLSKGAIQQKPCIFSQWMQTILWLVEIVRSLPCFSTLSNQRTPCIKLRKTQGVLWLMPVLIEWPHGNYAAAWHRIWKTAVVTVVVTKVILSLPQRFHRYMATAYLHWFKLDLEFSFKIAGRYWN